MLKSRYKRNANMKKEEQIMVERNWNQNGHNRRVEAYAKSKACPKNTDEFRTYEGIISAVITLLALFSGLLIQLLVYNIFDVRIQEVPVILVIVLWVGFSTVTTHIVSSLDL